jgi:hypothetical protein
MPLTHLSAHHRPLLAYRVGAATFAIAEIPQEAIGPTIISSSGSSTINLGFIVPCTSVDTYPPVVVRSSPILHQNTRQDFKVVL